MSAAVAAAHPGFRMHGFWRSAAAFRVRIALNLKGLPVTETMVDLDAGEQHAASYRAINPAAAVPTLVDGEGPALTQSLAILEYLDELYPEPPLLPTGRGPAAAAARARVRSLALTWGADSHPLIVPRVRTYLTDVLHVDADARTAWIRYWFHQGLTNGETRLARDAGTGACCEGDTPTIADLCLASQMAGARHAGVDTAAYPVSARIFAHCMTLDAFARAHPLRQEGAPAGH